MVATTGNLKSLELFQKINKVVGHVAMGLQLLFVITIFLCCLHIALLIFEANFLEFMDPFFNWARETASFLFGSNIKQAETAVDGREVLFILFSMVVSFFMSQIRLASKSYDGSLAKKIVEEKQRLENEFNQELKTNIEQDIMAQSHYVFAIQFKAKSLIQESVGVKPLTAEEINQIKLDAVSRFYEMMKNEPGIKFSKDGEILLAASGSVNKVDAFLDKVFGNLETIRAEYKAKKISIKARMAIDSHKMLTTVNTVYQNLKPLLGFNVSNEILCYGNFRNRYQLIKDPTYIVAVKGKYDMVNGNEETIWSIMKKD